MISNLRQSLGLLLVILSLSGLSYAQKNPFFSRPDTAQTQQNEDPSVQTVKQNPLLKGPFSVQIAAWQKYVKEKITGFAREIKQEPFGASLWLFLLFSFVYGVIHALGPGHGKSVVAGYFLGNSGTYWQGVAMSSLLTTVHVISAVVLVLVVRLVLKLSGMADFELIRADVEKYAYAMLAVVGFVLLVFNFRELKKGHFHTPILEQKSNLKKMMLTAVGTGAVPCPVTAIVLIFSMLLGITWAGFLACFFIAGGMALTTSSFAVLTLFLKGEFLKRINQNRKGIERVHLALSFAASLFIMGLGILLFSYS
jgi:ABC-type nickel/cobalt efflux system permease component RcnA